MKDPRSLVNWHKFLRKHAPDTTGWYYECRRCGKQVDDLNPGSGTAVLRVRPPQLTGARDR